MPSPPAPKPGPAQETPLLILRFQSQVKELDGHHAPLLIGRGPRNHFALPDEESFSSRSHARVEPRPDGFFVIDQSSNGTYLLSDSGGRQILRHEEFRLSGKGVISLGREIQTGDPYLIAYEVVGLPSKSPTDDLSSTRCYPPPGETIPAHLELLRDSPLGRDLTETECLQLARLIELRNLITSEPLVEEGETGSHLYCIVSGSLGVYAITDNTIGSSCLHILETGDLAGEFGFVEKIERTATLRAMGPTQVFCLDRTRFGPFVELHPMIGYKLLRTIVHSVRQSLIRLNLEKMDLETTLRRYLRKGK